MNQFLFRTFLTTLILLSIPITTKAYDFEYDGLYYNITSEENKTVEVTLPTIYGPDVKGSVIIPEKVRIKGKEDEYTVTSIGSQAFYSSKYMTSIEIPNSVTSIGNSAFSFCDRLTAIVIPNSVTYIGGWAFSQCTSLTSIKIPNSVTSIEEVAFSGCSRLTSIKIPNSVTSIGKRAFSGCSRLISIVIPNSVTSIGESAFSECKSLTSIEIPTSVTDNGDSMFRGCTNLRSATIASQTTGNKTFEDCTSLTTIDIQSTVNTIGEYAFSGCTKLASVSIPNSVTSIGKYAFSRCTGLRKVIIPNSITDIEPYDSFSGCINATIYAYPIPYAMIKNKSSYAKLVLTGVPKFEIASTTPHQESCELIIKKSTEPTPDGYEDLNLTVVERGIYFDGYYPCNDGGKATIKNLRSNRNYDFDVYTKYSDGSIVKYNNTKLKTTSLGLKVANQLYSTSVTASGAYTLDDAKFESEYITFNGEKIEGNKIAYTGLKPETKYSGTYTVTTQGGSSETKNFSFTTPALKIEILDPRPVSEKCAIVAATTNMSDHETSAGFQWRKYEAPASLKSSEGYAAIYGGKLEGYIKNLQSTSYYNVRAFYKASDNTYYYSDWVTFDPSDFSYFEPTVHTYPTAEVASTSATVKGYALAGSDDIIQQGIEYWASGSHNAPKKVAAAMAAADGINTVFSTGQVMTVTLTDLKPETTYCYRAFVKTQAGTTYGEEQSFTTPEGQSGVDSVIVDNEREVIGYYDLTGRRYDVPQRGLNIIVYSDGTTEKVVIRQ